METPDGFTRNIGPPLVDGSGTGVILAPRIPKVSSLLFPEILDVADAVMVAVAFIDVLDAREPGEIVGI